MYTVLKKSGFNNLEDDLQSVLFSEQHGLNGNSGASVLHSQLLDFVITKAPNIDTSKCDNIEENKHSSPY